MRTTCGVVSTRNKTNLQELFDRVWSHPRQENPQTQASTQSRRARNIKTAAARNAAGLTRSLEGAPSCGCRSRRTGAALMFAFESVSYPLRLVNALCALWKDRLIRRVSATLQGQDEKTESTFGSTMKTILCFSDPVNNTSSTRTTRA